MAIIVGGITNPDALSDSKINLGNPNNPVSATYAGSVTTGSVVDNIWTRTALDASNHIIYPTDYTKGRLALGYNAFSGSERLRVNGNILTTSLTGTILTGTTLSINGGSYYGNITGTFTATRAFTLPDSSGTFALTSDIYTFANQALLATYTNTNVNITSAITNSHTHSNKTLLDSLTSSGDGSTFLDNSGTYRGVLVADISDFPTSLTPTAHIHTINQVTSFNVSSPQDNQILRYDTGTGFFVNEDLTVAWGDITSGVPSTFTPSPHTHDTSKITNIDETGILDGDVLMYDSGDYVAHTLHIFANESILDNITQDVIDNEHTHTNLSILEQLTQDIIDDTHTHTNLTLLETITDGGAGTNYLSDDGTYKAISIAAAGSDTQITFNDSGSASGDSTFTFDTATKIVSGTIFQASTGFYVEDSATSITEDGSTNMVFTDAVSGSVTLAALVAGATNYWTATTGGIYYSSYISNHTNPAAELDINGQIITDEGFISTVLRYTGSNLLLGPNAGDNEASSNKLYIHNSNSATPLIYGDFTARLLRIYGDLYIPNNYAVNFGSSTNSIWKYTAGDELYFKDGVANGGASVSLSQFIDGTYNTLVADFDDLATVQGITSADTAIWDNASVLITGGGGDLYLANDGTYKPTSAGGLSTHLYLHNEASDIGTYEKLLTSPANDVEDSDTVAVTTGTSPVLLDIYATDPGYPGITEIPAGLWTFKTWLSVDSAVGTTTVDIEVYKRDTGGTETLLFSVTTPEINATSATQYIIETVQTAQALDATDRLVVKYYTSTTTASSIDVTLYYEGTSHYSYMIIPLAETTFEINDSILKWDTSNLYYAPYDDKTDAGGALSDGKFYLGTDDPDDTTRLNYDGDFHATSLESVGDTTIVGDLILGSNTISPSVGYVTFDTTDIVIEDAGLGISTSGTVRGRMTTTADGLYFATYETPFITDHFFINNSGDLEFIQEKYLYQRQTLNTDTNNDWREYSDATSLYFDRYESLTWTNKLEVGTDYISIPTGSTYQINGTDLDATDVAAEPELGNPASDGYVLSSTAAGVRSWVEMVATGLDLSGETANGILYNDSGSLATDSGFLFTGSTKTAGAFYTLASNPTNNNRMNYDGYFYATRFYGILESSYGTFNNFGVNTYAGSFYSRNAVAITAGLQSTVNAPTAYSILELNRECSSTTYDITGNIIEITDNPTTSGTISGKVLSATIGSTERISFNPRATTSGSAVAYMFDTHNNLTTFGDKLLSIRNYGDEKFYIDKDGETLASKYKLSALNTAPSSASDTGTTGEIRVVADFIYVCIATDTWVRTPLATW